MSPPSRAERASRGFRCVIKLILTVAAICGLILWYGQAYVARAAIAVTSSRPDSMAPPAAAQHALAVHVNASKALGKVGHFWRSTGFSPPEPHSDACPWFLSDDLGQNLAYIGALPRGGIQQVRIHYLLDLVTVDRVEMGQPTYDFTCLDLLMERLRSNGLDPGFELMGNPSGFFKDFENDTQASLWRDLVQQVALRYIARYGVEAVSRWNFESWNEPKEVHFDGLNFTLAGFNNYYDACSEGLRVADARLRLGAPGGNCHRYHPDRFCWSLLAHIQSGFNYFTGLRGGRLDFLSIHRKGSSPNNVESLLRDEIYFLWDLKRHLPKLATVPIVNNEADPLMGWTKVRDWRADATYAAIIVKNIVLHHRIFADRHEGPRSWPFEYQLLSNDNGFMSYQPHVFSQRTLLARFQVNDTSGSHVHFIQKPAYSVMGLLALLGERQLDVSVYDVSKAKTKAGHQVGVLGTQSDLSSEATQRPSANTTQHHPTFDTMPHREWSLSILLYNSEDTVTRTTAGSANILLHVNSIPKAIQSTTIMYVVYTLDNEHGNPYVTWLSRGSPATPTAEQLQEMRDNQKPARTAGPLPVTWLAPGVLAVDLFLPLPGVALVQLCARGWDPPGQVAGTTVREVTSGVVLITWDDNLIQTKCINTYQVEHSWGLLPFMRINHEDTIFNSFVYAPVKRFYQISTDMAVQGTYRVRAVDFWGRSGDYSPRVSYNAHH